MATIPQSESKPEPKPEVVKLLQVQLPEQWMRHIDVEAAKRGIKRKGLVLKALTAFIGEAPDYAAEAGTDAA